MIQHAIDNVRRQIPDEDIMFSELPSALQHDFTWEELKALISALGGVSDEVISTSMYIFPPEEYWEIWSKTIIKIFQLAMQHFSQLRIQPCRNNGCDGNLIFINHDSPDKGKISLITLLPDSALDHAANFTEDMYGYIIAFCPSCGFVQLYDVPEEIK